MKNTLTSSILCTMLSAGAFLNAQTARPILPLPPPMVSTVPSNGDVNPYGVAFVPRSIPTDGVLQPGDILVSNFNNAANLQGTGTTITRVTERGETSTFFQGKPGLGLTAALGVVKRGLVFVGNLPTADGTSATVQPGSLLILNRKGQVTSAFTNPGLIDGPWGMAVHDQDGTVQLFISNVLNGTVIRMDLAFFGNTDVVGVRDVVRIGTGYNHRLDPAALVLGPSGLAYDAQHDILYVASSADNAVYAITDAGSRNNASEMTGKIIYQDNVHLHGPLDLVLAPNGHLIVANSDGSNVDPNQPSELVEFTTAGKFVSQFSVDKNNGGAFGLGLVTIGNGAFRFAAVDDNTNTLSIWAAPIN